MNKNSKEENNNSNEQRRDRRTPESNDLLSFLLGIILLCVGLFMLSKRVTVHSSWYMWHMGNFDFSSGSVIIPLLIGIIWYFFDSKSFIPKIIITLSVIFLVVSIIMSVRINFVSTSLFDYILILGMAAAGSGLLLKAIFKKKEL